MSLQSKTVGLLSKKQVDMTVGPELKVLLTFLLPMVIGSVFDLFYNYADTWVLGNFVNNEAYAAVGGTSTTYHMLSYFVGGFGSGTGVIMARLFGAKDREGMRKTLGSALILMLLLGGVLAVVGIAMTPVFLKILKMPEELKGYARTYLIIVYAGLIPSSVNAMLGNLQRGIGDSAHSVFYGLICNLLNVPINLFFVLVLHMDVAGVALSTVLCQCLNSWLLIRVMLQEDYPLRPVRNEIKLHGPTVRKICVMALPISLQYAVNALSLMLIQRRINAFGASVISGYATYSKLDNLACVALGAMCTALSAYVGQNMGAKKYKRAKRGTWLGIASLVGFMVVITVICYIFAPAFARFFNPDADAVAAAVQIVRIIMPFCLFHGISHSMTGAIRGVGDSRTPMLINLLSFVGVRQLYLLIMDKMGKMTLRSVMMTFPVGWIACALVLCIFFFRIRWQAKAEEGV